MSRVSLEMIKPALLETARQLAGDVVNATSLDGPDWPSATGLNCARQGAPSGGNPNLRPVAEASTPDKSHHYSHALAVSRMSTDRYNLVRLAKLVAVAT